jgi:hypothetical protein
MDAATRMKKIRSAILIALFGLGSYSRIAAAADIDVKLEGSQEVPAVTTTAAGTGKITVADDGTVTGSIDTTGIDGTMAHIHTGAKGANGPPLITLTKSGNKFSVPANSKLTDAQRASLDKGELYINVHSAAYPNGEIRAQLTN